MVKKFTEENKRADDYFTDKFNLKPFKERREMAIYTLQTQINQIKIERIRLSNNYKRADKEAKDHLENCLRDLRRYYNEEMRGS
jgi:lipase chaperone LimK